MIVKKALIVGGMVAALAVPAGAAFAATNTPSPGPAAPSSTTQPYGPRFGAGHPGGGYGDPADCPYYNSAEHQAWMQARQQQMQQLHDQLWSGQTSGS